MTRSTVHAVGIGIVLLIRPCAVCWSAFSLDSSIVTSGNIWMDLMPFFFFFISFSICVIPLCLFIVHTWWPLIVEKQNGWQVHIDEIIHFSELSRMPFWGQRKIAFILESVLRWIDAVLDPTTQLMLDCIGAPENCLANLRAKHVWLGVENWKLINIQAVHPKHNAYAALRQQKCDQILKNAK